MTAPALHQHQFARGFSLLPACAKGRPAHPSHAGRAATQSTLYDQEQGSTGTALGRRLVMYRSTRALGTTGRRVAGLGCFSSGCFDNAVGGYDLLPTGRGLSGSGRFWAEWRDCRRALAIDQHRRQSAFQCLTQRHKGHLKISRSDDPKPRSERRPKSWKRHPTRIAT